jgi:transaldolase/glucose-6-phosphate isomerase
MAAACGPEQATAKNPGLVLGAALGELARAGRDKLLLVTPPRLRSFGAWVEQLVAESTGKQGRGIVPVVELPAVLPAAPTSDQYVVVLCLAGERIELPAAYAAAVGLGELPLITIELAEIADLAQEFYRWELATAMAGAVLGINPFDQPDVEAAKIKTRELLAQYVETGSLPAPVADFSCAFWDLHGLKAVDYGATGVAALTAFLDCRSPGAYIALMAFLPATAEIAAALERLRLLLWQKNSVAVTLGFGPRFLHSTGQLHKGDANRGRFIQLTADILEAPLPVPGTGYDFATLIAAQADGDYAALRDAGRRVCRLHFHADPVVGIGRLLDLLDA